MKQLIEMFEKENIGLAHTIIDKIFEDPKFLLKQYK